MKYLCKVIEDNVFANNNEQQKVIKLKGIENDYFYVNNIRNYLIQGDSVVSAGDPNTAIMGMHIINELGIDVNAPTFVTLYYPNPDITNPADNPLEAFQTLKLHPAGVFHVEEEFDNTYVLASLLPVQNLFHRPGYYSSLELSTETSATDNIRKQLQQILGEKFKIETRYEQNKTLYMVMGAEKWAIYIILLLVLLIATFNMVGALSMLVLEKQKDIAILRAMGALPATIRKIFLLEGLLWSAIGGISGILLGTTICLVQLKLSLLKMGGGFLVDAFPVKMMWHDYALVLFTILAVGFLASWYPAIRATKVVDPSLKSA